MGFTLRGPSANPNPDPADPSFLDPNRVPVRGLNTPADFTERLGGSFTPKGTTPNVEGTDFFRTGPQPHWMGKTMPTNATQKDDFRGETE